MANWIRVNNQRINLDGCVLIEEGMKHRMGYHGEHAQVTTAKLYTGTITREGERMVISLEGEDAVRLLRLVDRQATGANESARPARPNYAEPQPPRELRRESEAA